MVLCIVRIEIFRDIISSCPLTKVINVGQLKRKLILSHADNVDVKFVKLLNKSMLVLHDQLIFCTSYICML